MQIPNQDDRVLLDIIEQLTERANLKLPHHVSLTRDHSRCDRALRAIKTVCKVAKSQNPDVKFALKQARLGTTLCLEIISDWIPLELPALHSALGQADFCEVFALADGRVIFGMEFRGVWRRLPALGHEFGTEPCKKQSSNTNKHF